MEVAQWLMKNRKLREYERVSESVQIIMIFHNFSALEEEQQNYLNLVETIAQDITPLGKLNSEPNNEDSDESGESDGGESSASEGDVDDHDESDNDNEHIELSQ